MGIALSIVLLAVAVLAGASLYFYRLSVARSSKEFLRGNPDLENMSEMTLTREGQIWVMEQEARTVELAAFDGLKLRATYYAADRPTINTVIIAHGYSGRGEGMGAFGRFFHQVLGWNVLMPDNRGHGSSEGRYIGFGWHDRLDYLGWIDYIIQLHGPKANIVLHGVSMGGATVLMVSGEKLQPQVKAIISDCAYTSAKDVLTYQLKRMYKLPPFPLIPSTSLATKLSAGYFLGEASALSQVRKAAVPILFIHGDQDRFVPFEMVHSLYEACGSEKELFVVPLAGHGTSYEMDREGYERKIAAFIGRLLPGLAEVPAESQEEAVHSGIPLLAKSEALT